MTAVRADATSATSGTPAASNAAPRIGAISALALAAMSNGLIVPALRLLVESTGHGKVAAGVFMASHVLGGALGAALAAPALRLAGSPRALILRALLASAVVTLAMAAIDSLAIRIALRFADGAFHLLAVTALVAVATSGDPEARARRSVMMGLAIVLGIAAGLGLGALLAHPALALVVSAALSCTSLVIVIAQPSEPPPPAEASASADAGARPRFDRTTLLAPGLLAFGERFTFGTLTVAAPFITTPRQSGTVLGIFMTASALALPLARRYALAWGPVRLAVRSAVGFAATLAVTCFVDVFGASMAISIAWALFGGASAAALYAAALVLVARSVRVEDRLSAMGTVHAGGNAGFALGTLCAGTLSFALPGMLVVAIPGIIVALIATVAAWRLAR